MAERAKVQQPIRDPIVVEGGKRDDVVNVQGASEVGFIDATGQAAIAVPLPCCCPLAVPVRAFVMVMPAAPEWILGSTHCEPFIEPEASARTCLLASIAEGCEVNTTNSTRAGYSTRFGPAGGEVAAWGAVASPPCSRPLESLAADCTSRVPTSVAKPSPIANWLEHAAAFAARLRFVGHSVPIILRNPDYCAMARHRTAQMGLMVT